MSRRRNQVKITIEAKEIEPTETTLYLDDGKSKIDAILVHRKNKVNEVEIFLEKLKETGLVIESVPATTNPDLIFVKIHAPNTVLEKYADEYGISFRKDSDIIFPKPKIPFAFLENLLNSTHPDPDDPVSKRAWHTISKAQPTIITSCERSVVVFLIMDNIQFGENDVGIRQLLHKNVILEAYPLHDGPWEWPDDPDEPINDRQLLAKYWASFSMLFKEQPLDTVKHYFGYEMATYFSWFGLYNKMLVYAVIFGIISFVGGLLFVNIFDKKLLSMYCLKTQVDNQICNKQLALTNDFSSMERISNICPYVYITYMNSNLITCVYSVIIVFWCTIFKEAWKRKLSVQNAVWDNPYIEDFMLRPQFVAYAKKTRPHKYTGEPELYIPFCEKILRHTVSFFGTFLIIIVVIANLVAVVYLEIHLTILHYTRIGRILIINVSTLITMVILELMFNNKVLDLLTKFEMPQTELAYEKSVEIKSFIFLFFNSYGMLMYTAFIKGKCAYFTAALFKYDSKEKYFLFPNIHCMPPSCVFEVLCLLTTIIIFKPTIFSFMKFLVISIWSLKRQRTLPLNSQQKGARWECDYVLPSLYHRNILNEMNKLIIQFGFVTFFASSGALVPLVVLVFNILKIRLNARRVVKFFKRPIEKKQVTSIGVCFDIFEAMAYVAIIINALYTAYTCKFIHWYFYYIDSYSTNPVIINEYSPVSNNVVLSQDSTAKIDCFLSGFYDDKAPGSYPLNVKHYDYLKYKASLALIFMLLGFLVSGILSYIIPDVPRDLQEFIHFHKQKEKNKNL